MKQVELQGDNLAAARQELQLEAPEDSRVEALEEYPLGDLTMIDLDVYARAIGAEVRVYLVKL